MTAALDSIGVRFPVTVCAADVIRGKPDPEPYRLAAARLGVAPGRSVALEDSPTGIRSAHAAGLTVVAVPSVPPPPGLARLTRLVRSGMLDIMGHDYVRTARAKGLHESRVIFGHALKNAAIPLVTVIGLDLGALLGGAVVTEQIFAWPGVGLEVIIAINGRDFPVVQAAVFVVATSFVLINLIVDLLYTWLDPRVRLN